MTQHGATGTAASCRFLFFSVLPTCGKAASKAQTVAINSTQQVERGICIEASCADRLVELLKQYCDEEHHIY
jgi:hypothetical protein